MNKIFATVSLNSILAHNPCDDGLSDFKKVFGHLEPDTPVPPPGQGVALCGNLQPRPDAEQLPAGLDQPHAEGADMNLLGIGEIIGGVGKIADDLITTFKEVGTGLDMDINKFYVLTDSGSFYTSQGFDSAEDALNWARGPEGIEAGADQGVIVPTFAGPQEGWPELSGANVFYARDLYDFWTANCIEIEGETE